MSDFPPCQHGRQGHRQGKLFKAISITSSGFASPSPVRECMQLDADALAVTCLSRLADLATAKPLCVPTTWYPDIS